MVEAFHYPVTRTDTAGYTAWPRPFITQSHVQTRLDILHGRGLSLPSHTYRHGWIYCMTEAFHYPVTRTDTAGYTAWPRPFITQSHVQTRLDILHDRGLSLPSHTYRHGWIYCMVEAFHYPVTRTDTAGYTAWSRPFITQSHVQTRLDILHGRGLSLPSHTYRHGWIYCMTEAFHYPVTRTDTAGYTAWSRPFITQSHVQTRLDILHGRGLSLPSHTYRHGWTYLMVEGWTFHYPVTRTDTAGYTAWSRPFITQSHVQTRLDILHGRGLSLPSHTYRHGWTYCMTEAFHYPVTRTDTAGHTA